MLMFPRTVDFPNRGLGNLCFDIIQPLKSSEYDWLQHRRTDFLNFLTRIQLREHSDLSGEQSAESSSAQTPSEEWSASPLRSSKPMVHNSSRSAQLC
jgi:hypothetical protein